MSLGPEKISVREMEHHKKKIKKKKNQTLKLKIKK